MTGAMIRFLIERDAAIHDAAADLRPHRGLIHFRIPAPLLFAGARIDRENDAPVRDAVDRAVRIQAAWLPVRRRPGRFRRTSSDPAG